MNYYIWIILVAPSISYNFRGCVILIETICTVLICTEYKMLISCIQNEFSIICLPMFIIILADELWARWNVRAAYYYYYSNKACFVYTIEFSIISIIWIYFHLVKSLFYYIHPLLMFARRYGYDLGQLIKQLSAFWVCHIFDIFSLLSIKEWVSICGIRMIYMTINSLYI